MLKTFRASDFELVSTRLQHEFSTLSRRRVNRCVADTHRCAEHLGFEATPNLVERVAREHLQGMLKSEPPSECAGLLPQQLQHDYLS